MWKLISIFAFIFQCSGCRSAPELLQPVEEVSLNCGPITFLDSYTEYLECSLKDVKSSKTEVAVTSSDVDMDGLRSRENIVNIDITGDDKYPEYFPRHLAKTLAGTSTFTYTKTPLRIIKRGDFKDFGAKLSILSLPDNKIEELPFDAFTGLKNLRNLLLNNNKIKKLPSNLFPNAPNLDIISVNFNELTELHPELFKNCPKLDMLSAEHNKISKIDKDLFKNNANLQMIFMKHNKIGKIPIDFSKFEMLNIADFTHNDGTCDTFYSKYEPYDDQYDAEEKKKWIKTVPEFQKKIGEVC